MKLHDLAIIFIIIILPISMILSAYVDSRVETLRYQTLYDEKLLNATYDTVIAYQKNTLNSTTSDLSNSKLRDIEGAAKAFFNSLGENFDMAGYGKKGIEQFVPALVFTMYDGYYIYSQYDNTLDEEGKNTEKNQNNEGTTTDGEKVIGLKPYIYYSCRYVNSSCDVVINYSLDSYVEINGIVDTKAVNLRGYLLTTAEHISDTQAKYKDIEINPEEHIKETAILVDKDDKVIEGLNDKHEFLVKKEDGVKYYNNGTDVYMNLNSKGIKQSYKETDAQNNQVIKYHAKAAKFEDKNTQAVNYYIQAADLKKAITETYTSLKGIKASDAVDENGNPMEEFKNNNIEIFGELTSTKNIEDKDSDFNNHKFDVIKHSIERNLSIAISNYNKIATGTTTEFMLPKLHDYEWERIFDNISVISFLQGLPIGGKIYSGHSIVNNTKNEDYVSEDSIKIVTNDNIYHNVKDTTINASGARGYLNTDFEIKDSIGGYYSPREEAQACYNCIISSETNSDKTIDEIISANSELAKIYYTALGRERYSMYRIGNHK